jgi:hypothetical protein
MTWGHAFSALTLLTMFGAMAWLITHARTETIYRPLAIVAFFIGFPAVYMTLAMATGTPKPAMFYNVPEEGIVLGYKPETGKNIYVLLDMMNGPPVYYLLPWNSQTAEKIEQALREGKGTAKLRYKKTRRPLKGIYDWDWPWDIPDAEVVIDPTEVLMPEKDAGNPTAGMQLAPGTGND